MGNQPARGKRARHDGEFTRFYETLAITSPIDRTWKNSQAAFLSVNEKAIDVT